MDYENQQACGTCQQTKPLTCFPKNRAKKSGHGAKCKDCRKAYYRDWYSKNRASVIAATKRYYADNTEACKAARKRYAEKHPEKVRAYGRKANRKAQGLPAPTRPCPDHCEMCLRPPGDRALHLDHCHTTGAFRGWLCGSCNTAFGRLGDSFEEAQKRLQRYKSTVNQGE